MKILYAVQGTGNGHVSRASEIVPLLKEFGDVDVLISGIQSDLDLDFEVKYRFYGLGFIFGKKGGVDLWQTFMKSKPLRLLADIQSLPVNEYDLVISDFEPVSSWACKLKRKACIGLSHQNAVLLRGAPIPKEKDRLGSFILKHYAPSSVKIGFHFNDFTENVYTPVIREKIRRANSSNKGHFTVYLPAYSDEEIISVLGLLDNIRWQVFSKHTQNEYEKDNILVRKVSVDGFTKSFLSCAGILCTAGFEAPAEALFLGKKLCVIPMINQYEQQCNAAFLESMGIRVIQTLKGNDAVLRNWINEENTIQINYPDQTSEILKMLVSGYGNRE